MKLMGRVWNTIPQHERLTLLRHCKTVMAESIKQHESTLTWDELWPMRQDELCDVDAEAVLKRDLQPVTNGRKILKIDWILRMFKLEDPR